MMQKLFLLNPNFKDEDLNNGEALYFCQHSAFIEGVLSYYPYLRGEIDIVYVDFKRPRKPIIDLVGEEHQSCPLLVISNIEFGNTATNNFNNKGKLHYTQDTLVMIQFWAFLYSTGTIHP